MPPFTREMAKRHKKGLSAKQQRQWVHVARSTFSSCKRDGGSDSACEARAIRAANSVTGTPALSTERHLVVEAALTVPPRRQTLHNREHLVADAVLIVEGVLNGAYVAGSALLPDMWDGMPVVLGHPLNAEGIPISARAPDVYDQYGIGHVYRTRVGTGQRGSQQVASLQAELWLDMDRIEALGGEALQALEMLENEQLLELSTGFYAEAVLERGAFYGEPYHEMLHSIRPDHLALLPNGIGACSLEHGCGAPRLHEGEHACGCTGETCTCEESLMEDAPPRGWRGFVQVLRDFVAGETADPPAPLADPDDQPPPEDDEDDEQEDPEAEAEVAIADVPHAESHGPAGPQTEETPMTVQNGTKVVSPAIKARVNALINNERTGWNEGDRHHLETMSEAALIRLGQETIEREPPPPAAQPGSLEEAVALHIPQDFGMRETITSAVRRYERHKSKLIDIVVNAKSNPFTREELASWDDTRLEQLVVMAGEPLPDQTPPHLADVPANYTGRHMPQIRIVNNEEDAVPPTPNTLDLVIARQRELGLRA